MHYFKIYINFINNEEISTANSGKPLLPQERFLLSYIANFPSKNGFTGSVENLKFIAKKNRKSLLKTLKKLVKIGILTKTDIPHFRTKKYCLNSKFQDIYDNIKKQNDRYFYVRFDFLDEIDEIDLLDMMIISYITSFPEGYNGLQRDLCNVLGCARYTIYNRLKKIKNDIFIINGNTITLTPTLQQKLYIHSLKT